MTSSKTFPFDPAQMAEFLKGYDFIKDLETLKMSELDGDDLLAVQKKNMAALVEANKSVAVGYQALFAKQVEAFEAAITQNRGSEEGVFDEALESITALADAAQKANDDAFEVISENVQKAVAEFQELAEKSKSQD